ncbi:MAG: TerD family protein, partial [Klebsiella grimontii]|nr:TerD family protein [Klebsiella grimontii]
MPVVWVPFVRSTASTHPDKKSLFSLFSRGVGHPAPTSTISRSDKMAVSLVKGGNVSLTKEAPSMNVALVGLGWDARVTDGQAFDLDASVFLVGEDGKVLSDAHFVFYNNTTSPD